MASMFNGHNSSRALVRLCVCPRGYCVLRVSLYEIAERMRCIGANFFNWDISTYLQLYGRVMEGIGLIRLCWYVNGRGMKKVIVLSDLIWFKKVCNQKQNKSLYSCINVKYFSSSKETKEYLKIHWKENRKLLE